MRKIMAAIILICIAFCISCGTVSGINGERKNALRNYDDVFTEIIACLEKGEYGDANTLIREEIKGNIILENEANLAFYDYTSALYDDYNKGVLDTEDIKTICAAGAQTDYASYFASAEFMINNLMQSKMQFQNGKDAYDSGDYELALTELELVSQNDTNYPESVALCYEILKGSITGTEPAKLKLAASAADTLQAVVSLGDNAIEKEYISEEDMLQLMSDCAKAYSAYAVFLENNGQLWHAVQQYARAAVASDKYEDRICKNAEYTVDENGLTYVDEDGRVSQSQYGCIAAYNEYRRIMHQLHPAYIESDDGYYKINSNNMVESTGETDWTVNSGGLLEVLSLKWNHTAWSSDSFFTEIDVDGKVWISASRYNEDSLENIQFVDSINNYETDALAIDMLEDHNNALLVLYSDGTIKVFAYDGRSDNVLLEAEHWSDIVQISESRTGDLLGLRSDGTIISTSGMSQFAYSDLFDFEGVVELSTGADSRSSAISQSEYFIKFQDGTAKHMRAVNYESHVASYDCPKPMLDFYGGFYLTPDGKIRFVFDAEDKYLQKHYADSTYIKLSGPDKNYDFYNCVAAWTSDTEFEIIYASYDQLKQMDD